MTRHAATTDPTTSHEAAKKAEESGLVENDSSLLLGLIRQHPGSTMKELAWELARSEYEWEACRQRLGRRTGDLLKAGLAHPKGKRDGCQLWWPGKEPAAPGEGEQRALFDEHDMPVEPWEMD